LRKVRLLKNLSWPLRQSQAYKVDDHGESSEEELDVLAELEANNDREDTNTGELHFESLFELCATTILNNVDLTSQLQKCTPFSVADIFLMLGPTRTRVKRKLESSTLSLRGNRMGTVELCSTIQHMSSNFACLGALVLDRVASMSDGVLSKFLLMQNGKPMLPTVRHISLSDNPLITDVGVKKLLTAYGARLQGMCLNNTSATYKVVKLMAKVNPSLETVGLAYMTHMRDKHIQRLVTGCPKIVELDVSYCQLLTDASVESMPGLYHLQSLNMSYNQNIGDGVSALSRNPFLRSLRLQDCRRVNHISIAPVIRGCSLLDTLCVRGCPQLTLAVVKVCAEHCTMLRALDVTACPQINGDRALGILARGTCTRESLKEFVSTKRVVMHASPMILDLYTMKLE